MGSFLLGINQEQNLDNEIFKQRDQKLSYEYKDKTIDFKKYSKSLLDYDPFIAEFEKEFIIGQGTISYKSLSAKKGFEKLALELHEHKLENNELFGHFSIIHFIPNQNKLNIYFDESSYCAPYVINNKIISSSFLSCVENVESLTLHKEAIFEQIYTGCYFDGKTTFNEIRKITKAETWQIDGFVFNFIPVFHRYKLKEFISQKQAIEVSLNTLDLYFQRWKIQAKEHFSDIGLSSGYDSRLMLALMDKNFNDNYQVHCYWKKKKDFDNIVAEQLATIVNKILVSVPIQDRDLLTDEKFKNQIHDAMIYYDGLYPSNHGWVRAYRTKEYRSKVLGKSRFGFSGLNGEQYRNEFNLLNKNYTISYLINNILLEKNNDDILDKSSYKSKGRELLRKSIVNALDLPNNAKRISRRDVQRLYSEMWVVGGPGIRNQIENNLAFFLSPFTEKFFQKISYSTINFLGLGGRFQSKMITKINPRLAAIISDYGFSFNNVPIKQDIKVMLSSIVKRKWKMKFAAILKPKQNDYLDTFGIHKHIVEKRLKYLENFKFSFPIDKNKFQQDTIDRLIALSTLLKYYESKL